ncbi:MAG: MBL fold metallo-hydrolase [Ignavibacteriae bacterium]|nr:MBL fold metallo-hydrolase [Ignavibacteriota bacterium]
MKVTILGTGTSQGVPVIGCGCRTCTSQNPKDRRLRTSAYIDIDGQKLLIDTSADFRQQMLLNKLDDVDAVLYTHHHIDHIAGMDDLRQINQRLDKFIDLYGNDLTMDEISITFRYVFDEYLINHKAVPLVNIHRIENKPFKIVNTEILPIEVIHGRLPIFGYRIHNFAYITDASYIPEEEEHKLEGLDVLILNALRIRPHPTHFNLEQATELALKYKAKKTYFTHITHDIFHDEISASLPPNIFLGYDGLTFELE